MKILHIPTGTLCLVSIPTNSYKIIHILDNSEHWKFFLRAINNNPEAVKNINQILTFDITEEYWEELKQMATPGGHWPGWCAPTVKVAKDEQPYIYGFNPEEFELI